MTASAVNPQSDVHAADKFASFVENFDLSSVPDSVIARAKLSILDAFGIALASRNYEFAKAATAAISELGGDGEYPVIGSALRLPHRDAAHLNSTLIHGLDFDDTHSEAVVHTSASAVPTMFISGLAVGASGAQALSSFVIASECSSRIGAAAHGGFHDKGFHPTGVVGAFGCTLAGGYLYGLNHEQLLDAQGIVLSKASGSLQFLDDGAWTKRSHPGWACVCAHTAVIMSKHGYFGPRDPYFGRYGLFPLHTHAGIRINTEVLVEHLGEHWEMSNIGFKPYPACHLTHAFADAALALKKQYSLDVQDIEQIVAYVHDSEIPVICEPAANKIRPQNSYDAQFSVNYLIAASLVRDRFGLAELEDDALTNPEILDLCSKTSYQSDPDSAYPNYYSGAIDIVTRDGRRYHHREQMHRGSAGNPMSEQDLTDKFLDNALRTISREKAEKVMNLVLDLENSANLKDLAETLTTR
jgi:2-methylcitrate dehydratase PrpD